MKTVAVLVLVLAAGAFAYVQFAKPEKRACAKLGELCGAQDKVQSCEETLVKVREIAGGAEAIATASSCLSDSKTCADATGCVTGAAVKVGAEALKDFAKGLGRALEK